MFSVMNCTCHIESSLTKTLLKVLVYMMITCVMLYAFEIFKHTSDATLDLFVMERLGNHCLYIVRRDILYLFMLG